MYRVILLLLLASPLFGQDPALDRLKREAVLLKAATPGTQSVSQFHALLRDWIESRLPANKASMPGSLSAIESGMQMQLRMAGMAGDLGDTDDIGPGYAEVEFHQFPELPDTLFVSAGASIPCGFDTAVYGYQFGVSRTRVIEDRPGGYGNPEMELAGPDAEGRMFFLTHALSVQCQSTWMGLAYSAYRFGATPGATETLLSLKHDFWFGNDSGPQFLLEPDGLVVEYLNMSVDIAVHNRTNVYRYLFGAKVKRADPVAFQPQDFAEEWLTRPWEEMQSRSAPETAEAHGHLHAGFLLAQYSQVVACSGQPGRWLIGLDINSIGDKHLNPPLKTYFLVHDLGEYRYWMESVSDTAPQGCSGDGPPSDKHPWIPPATIWALPK
jgi:hypothetical protein